MTRTLQGSPEAILAVLHEARDALVSAVAATGADTTQTRATAEKLGLDRTFVWRLRRVLSSPDLLAAVMDFPDHGRVEKICRACSEKGVPEAQVERLRRAAAELESLVAANAGDWETFTAMLGGLEYGDVTARQEEARRQIYQGASAIWGAQAGALLKTGIIDRNPDDPDQLDVARLEGLVNFRRLRAMAWPLYQTFVHDDDDVPVPMVSEPVEPGAMDRHGMPLLEGFSTRPLPPVCVRPTSAGKCFELEAGPLGNAGAMDLFFADFFPRMHPRYVDQDEDFLGARLNVTTPAEVAICDLFLHREVAMAGPPEVLLFDKLQPDGAAGHLMPLSSRPLLLGPGPGGCAVPQIPRYPEILAHVFSRLGKDLAEFVGHRLLMSYPTISTMLNIRYRLPERGDTG
jgi:hypothetical protein